MRSRSAETLIGAASSFPIKSGWDNRFVSSIRRERRPKPSRKVLRNPSVEKWAASVPVGDQLVSVFTITEIERGVIAKERSDSRQGAILRRNVTSDLVYSEVRRRTSLRRFAAAMTAAA